MNLSTVLYLNVFSRAEQRVLQAIFKVIADVIERKLTTAGRSTGTLRKRAHS
jgi:hypothetical protein